MIRWKDGKVDRPTYKWIIRASDITELADAIDVAVAALRFYAEDEQTSVNITAREALRQIGADHAER